MGKLTFDGIFYRVDEDQRVEAGMTIRRYDEVAHEWFEGEVSNVYSFDHETLQRTAHLSLVVQGYAPSPLQVGQEIEIVSKAELYNREMDRVNRIIMENREKPCTMANREEEQRMMRRYEQSIKDNMKSAEKDMTSAEDRRGFVIGAVLRLWEEYHRDKHIDESQFDRLIAVLASFSGGEYKNFITELVAAYKSGNPPTIIGY